MTEETTLTAARRLHREGSEKIGVLNFASAKHPGGGFLKGSTAQEESLCYRSVLYKSLYSANRYYETNKDDTTGFYSDWMIYSKDVPVFRDEELQEIEPYQVSILTCPAVNAKHVRDNFARKHGLRQTNERIGNVMQQRMERILQAFAHHGCETLVLGAFGCGVFKNDPEQVAYIFDRLLDPKRGPCRVSSRRERPWLSHGWFKRIVMAVPGPSDNHTAFEQFF
ncbi:MAG: TIGR02452 family protein [Nitrososphaerales archaeon]